MQKGQDGSVGLRPLSQAVVECMSNNRTRRLQVRRVECGGAAPSFGMLTSLSLFIRHKSAVTLGNPYNVLFGVATCLDHNFVDSLCVHPYIFVSAY